MNYDMRTNSQVSTTEQQQQKTPTRKQKQTKQLTRTESEKWRSHGKLSTGRGKGEKRGKCTGNKKHKW